EIKKFFPEVTVHQLACPMWVTLIENKEYDTPGADFFVKKYLDELLQQSTEIDTVLLACTHYPLLEEKIKLHLPPDIKVVSQGDIVADSIKDYLRRHPEIETKLTRDGDITFFTTDDPADFNEHASLFFGSEVQAKHL